MLTVLILVFSRIVSSTCVDPTTLTAPLSPAAYTYDIGDPDYVFNIPNWTQGAGCTFNENLSISPSLSSFDYISRMVRTITVSTSHVNRHGES